MTRISLSARAGCALLATCLTAALPAVAYLATDTVATSPPLVALDRGAVMAGVPAALRIA